MAESKNSNTMVCENCPTHLQMNLFKLIKRSPNPLSTVRELKEAGICLTCLNEHADIGTLLCKVTISNYGLGIKTLLDCGLNLSAEDSKTGDTPLLVVCAEGLCGPVTKLLDLLPPAALLHSNRLGSTALKLLLARSHGPCGCVRKLLTRLPLCHLLLPKEIASYFTLNSKIDHINLSQDVALLHNSNALLMSVNCLLEKIRSDDPGRILSVLLTWIKGNLLFTHRELKEIIALQH